MGGISLEKAGGDMLYSLGREDSSVVEWAKCVGPLADAARHFPARSLPDFIESWSKAVSYVGESELYARRAERHEVFRTDEHSQNLSAHAWARFEQRNRLGVEALGRTRETLRELREQLERFDHELSASGRDLRAELADFRTETFASFADIEMKKSDAEEIRKLTEDAIRVTAEQGFTGLAGWMDTKLAETVDVRQRPDRGAATNFAIWKLVAVIALLLALGIAFWIHCGWFSCSAYSRDNYIKAILVTAGLWWC
ncbi:hypothetical protein [Microbispora sp. NPDC046933]|uniref:hypothetical protein n=1 Tax=Microbispora sp. NPDC046933 TaxID=3155618 RepID=UPI00340E6016